MVKDITLVYSSPLNSNHYCNLHLKRPILPLLFLNTLHKLEIDLYLIQIQEAIDFSISLQIHINSQFLHFN